jgi:hypothetical protein
MSTSKKPEAKAIPTKAGTKTAPVGVNTSGPTGEFLPYTDPASAAPHAGIYEFDPVTNYAFDASVPEQDFSIPEQDFILSGSDSEPLRPGDIVRHRTGGPKLAVISPPDGETVTVEWFDERKGPQVGVVSLTAVRRVPTDPLGLGLTG